MSLRSLTEPGHRAALRWDFLWVSSLAERTISSFVVQLLLAPDNGILEELEY